MKNWIIGGIVSAIIITMSGCGIKERKLDTIEKGAQAFAEVLASGDSSQMDKLGPIPSNETDVAKIKPLKAPTEVRITKILKKGATFTYKIGKKNISSYVDFTPVKDKDGNVSYLPYDSIYASTYLTRIRLNGKSLGGVRHEVKFMPGEYEISYDDGVFKASGTMDMGIGSSIYFGKGKKVSDRRGDVDLHAIARPGRNYAEVLQKTLDSSGIRDCLESEECEKLADGKRIDTSNVTFTPGDNIDNAEFSGQTRVTVQYGFFGNYFENRMVDINDLDPKINFTVPRYSGTTKMYISYANEDSILRQRN